MTGAQPPTDATRDRILDAALACLRRYGGAKTKIEDIASEAGLARTGVYRYFSNKREIVAALADRWMTEDNGALAKIAADRNVAAGIRIERMARATARAVRTRYLAETCLMEVIDQVIRNLTSLIQQHRAETRGLYQQVIGEGLASGEFTSVEPARDAAALMDALEMFANPASAQLIPSAQLERRAGAVATLAVRGFGK
ncbi:TetR/AcrR family transcriptional regulator [Reyranella sp. CPCC 100927]|uniref:TetR/AcrR family transcriptional regulator n=1 Tax=Reyranella sp. CPCC 100927 TaxID=2599616 RepID=UPI0011B4B76B|nr:TetR/AcrR family transcriptional regulator [Reyranella sp. CPCC 100927]TWT14824.1 TetR/AcrR family transcriptional regulator [Reyranella sp. CPCC 100927]